MYRYASAQGWEQQVWIQKLHSEHAMAERLRTRQSQGRNLTAGP